MGGRLSAAPATDPGPPDPTACAGAALRVNGARVVLRSSGVLWLAQARILVAADLHLEKGSWFASRGQLLPPLDTRDTLLRLRQEVCALDPRRLVLLGDTFHDGGALDRLMPDDLALITDLAAGRELVLLLGNHDRDLDAQARRRGWATARDLRLGGLTFTHEPQPDGPDGEVAGHLHPCARIATAVRSVRRPCFVTDGRRLVLPAFGAFTGGLNVRDAAFSALFPGDFQAYALGEGRLHRVGRDRLLGEPGGA